MHPCRLYCVRVCVCGVVCEGREGMREYRKFSSGIPPGRVREGRRHSLQAWYLGFRRQNWLKLVDDKVYLCVHSVHPLRLLDMPL